MMRFRLAALAFAGVTVTSGSAPTDGLKIVVSESFPAGTKETTEYVGGDRARVESRISSRSEEQQLQRTYVQIRRCDLNRQIFLNVGAATYQSAAHFLHRYRAAGRGV